MHQKVCSAGIGVWRIGAVVGLLFLIGGGETWGGNLEDLLLENQQISIDQWIKLKAEEEKRQQKELEASRAAGDTPVRERWWEKISVRGYAQVRYNYLIDNDFLRVDQDRSIDETNQFFIRRARLIFS
ncbi:MAG: hypothetical protein NNA21_10405, partial [Nitrospira sp.]|nr:hypothetical protein [Nitrospira sp.]